MTPAGGLLRDPTALLVPLLAAYASGFAVIFLWSWRLQRKHGTRDARAAVPAAFLGGSFAGLSLLVMTTANQMDLLGV